MALSETRETFGAKSGETWPLLWVAVAGKKKKKEDEKGGRERKQHICRGLGWERALGKSFEPGHGAASTPESRGALLRLSAPRGAGLFMARSLHAASFQAPRGVGVLVPFPCLDKVVFR